MRRLLLSLFAAVALTNSAVAQLPPGMKRFETTKVADRIYTFRFLFHRNMFVVTDDGVIVTDPLNPEAAKILRAEIAKVTDLPVEYVVYSHEHWDRVTGGQIFRDEGARFISHAQCIDEFKRNPSPIVIIPEGTYKKRFDIELGGMTLELRYFGRNHGVCLTVMRLPKEKIAFIVDIVTPKRLPYRNMPDTYPLDWVRTLREMERGLDVTRIIPGHGPPIVPASAIREQREYLEDLIAAVKAVRETAPDPDTVRKLVKLPKYEKWDGYGAWLEMNVERINMFYHIGK